MRIAPDIATAISDGQHLCPGCGAPTPVAFGYALWPPTRRCATCGYVPPRVTGFAQLDAGVLVAGRP